MLNEPADKNPAEFPNERRVHRRHEARLRVQLIGNDTLPMTVKTVGVSLGGLHIECDRQQTLLMQPPMADGAAPPRRFTARIGLAATGAKSKTLTIGVSVADVNPAGDDVFRIGLRFDAFYGKSRELLEHFLQTLDS